jgi:sec-independent protein translocase protein TatB
VFNLSFLEIIVILIVGLVVVGPEELPQLIRKVRGLIRSARAQMQGMMDAIDGDETISSLKKEAEEINHSIHTVVDLEGNEQKAYLIEEVMEDLDKLK